MKMKVLPFLVLPWALLFLAIIAGNIVLGSGLPIPDLIHVYSQYLMWLGVALCLYSNLGTLSKAGIWLAHSLPSSLRRSPWSAFMRALVAGAFAYGFFVVGQSPWVPLVWQAAVLPVAFAISLFVIVWSLMGLVLTWSSQIAFSRLTAFVLSLPVFALVPITASFLGRQIGEAYVASRPEMPKTLVQAATQTEQKNSDQKVSSSSDIAKKQRDNEAEEAPTKESAKTLYELVQLGKSCADSSKDIQKFLLPNENEEVAYWAIRATKCAELKSVVALPKLAKMMVEHPSPKVRAAAILAMPRYGAENVRRIAYLLVKRISDRESQEVIEAASQVLSRLGETEQKWAHNRLKALLDSSKASGMAAKVLVEKLKSEELVTDYVVTHLAEQGPSRARAIKMICALPESQRQVAVGHIDSIVASVQTGAEDDPAIVALGCLGPEGFEAIRKEVVAPKRLQRPVAARALAEIDVKGNTTSALEIVKDCAKDTDDSVRKWCSQALGELGSAALPQILDLLKSNKTELKSAGQNALQYFSDPAAKQELLKVRAENSGWMANQKKLELAKAVDSALIKILNEENQPKSPKALKNGEATY